MEEFYKQERARQEKKSRAIGIVLAILMHLCLLVFGFVGNLKYLYPPPPPQEMILIEFDEPEKVIVRQRRDGSQPKAVNADPKEDIKLVQKSEAQEVGTKLNEAEEATVGEDGDVEVPEPPRKKEINKRALFHTANNKTKKDTLAPQTASEKSEDLKAGHAEGNTTTGKTEGEPNAKVKGRNVVGTLPKPKYAAQAEGIVVVDIEVDQYGKVTSAVPGAKGTTVSDSELFKAARKAAMETTFNVAPEAPNSQRGTITYVFKLKS